MYCCQQPVLARHIVGGRRDRPERRAAQHEFLFAETNKVSQIRVAARKLLDFNPRAFNILALYQVRQSFAQMLFQ